MNIENINEVELELKRFQKKLKDLKIRIKEDIYTLYGCREAAAIRRSSLDLTRSLSKMRNEY